MIKASANKFKQKELHYLKERLKNLYNLNINMYLCTINVMSKKNTIPK